MTMVKFGLPIVNIRDKAKVFQEISKCRPLEYIDRVSAKVHHYSLSNTFIALVENCRIIGHGSLIFDDSMVVHNVSSMNYRENIEYQLKDYDSVPDGGYLEGEHVLCWGMNNFGHWLFTYLMRLTLLYWRSELLNKKILVKDGIPKRFVDLLRRMGFNNIVFAKDGVKVEKLWVPSVVTYRGNYEDRIAYLYPPAVHLLRRLVLKNLEYPHPVRERLYLSRRNSEWRRVENEEDLAIALASLNVKRVYIEELPIEQQLDLIARAELIVIACGGGSPMTMFAPFDCRIIELNVPNMAGTFGSLCWAHVLGNEFHRIDGKPTEKKGPLEIDRDYRIDVGLVCDCILNSR